MIFNPSLKNRSSQEKSFRLKSMRGEEIEQVESLTYLGIKIDNKLLWELHIKQLNKNLLQAWVVIRKIELVVNSLFLKNLYHCMVHTHLKYGILGWGNAGKILIINLNKIHSKVSH